MLGGAHPDADELFRKGLAAYGVNDFEGAAALFHRAIGVERQYEHHRPDMRYLSYYGLCLAQAGHSRQMAIEACRKAVAQQPENPVMYLNLGRVYRLLGKTDAARKTLDDGLKLAPKNQSLHKELAPIDRRNSPVISVLSRANPLNYALGVALKKRRPPRRTAPRV